jgi:hypothetical protein
MGGSVLAAVGIGASVLGTGVGIFGQIRAGRAQAQAAEYQAAIDAYNSEVAKRMANDSRARGVVAVQEQQLVTRGQIGTQKAVLASRNIDISSGSALDIIGDTAMFGALDANTIRSNYEREAIGLETQSAGFSASSAMGMMAAQDARRAGVINAFSTALGGVSDTIGMLPRFQ